MLFQIKKRNIKIRRTFKTNKSCSPQTNNIYNLHIKCMYCWMITSSASSSIWFITKRQRFKFLFTFTFLFSTYVKSIKKIKL